MAIPLDITFQNLKHSDAVEARIREKAARLERFYDRITSCRVVVEQVSRQRTKGKIYDVRVDVLIPGGEIVASRSPGDNNAHEDVYVAIRDSFDAAVRQLEDYTRRRKPHQTKVHPAPLHGRVVRLFAEEGYGFITTQDDREVYFHRNAVEGDGWDELDVGAEVRFTATDGEKGPHALSVTPIGDTGLIG